MGALDNAKYEKFCQVYSSNGNNGTNAYLEAFSTDNKDTARAEAPRILAKPSVQDRIKELQKETEKKELITREGLIDEINKLNEQALADGQYSVVMKGIELKGKMIAAFTEKREVSANVDVKSPLAEAIKELRNNRGK